MTPPTPHTDRPDSETRFLPRKRVSGGVGDDIPQGVINIDRVRNPAPKLRWVGTATVTVKGWWAMPTLHGIPI